MRKNKVCCITNNAIEHTRNKFKKIVQPKHIGTEMKQLYEALL